MVFLMIFFSSADTGNTWGKGSPAQKCAAGSYLPAAHFLIANLAFQVTGADHRGLGVYSLPGDWLGLFFPSFFLFHGISLLPGFPLSGYAEREGFIQQRL